MQSTKIKVMTVLGTRPEIIRLSRVIPLLDQFTNHILVHTGQNYDYELNEIFFKDLELRKPDYFLNVDTTTLGSAVGDIIRKSEEVLKKENPDALLVLGDTNSCLAAYMAKRMHIPIFHMEAGNRCFDETSPKRPTAASSTILPISTWCTPTCPQAPVIRRPSPPPHLPHRLPHERSAGSLRTKIEAQQF